MQRKQFARMNSVVDNLEAVLIDATKVKGWKWVQQEPLWVTWSLENFGEYCLDSFILHALNVPANPVTRVPAVLKPYHRSLAFHAELVDELRSHTITFEKSREIVNKWVEQPWLEDTGWEAAWEDICEAEVERWGAA